MGGEADEKAARVRLGSYELRKKGISRFDLRDPYHLAIALTWPQLLAALLTLYLSVNFVFAALYWAGPGSVANVRPHSFADNLFFSIETLATVGYGEMYPATTYGRVVAAIEIVCGLAFTAILTGLTFVRFSRPRAKLVFAANPVVAMHNGKPTLMVRIGNGRPAILADGGQAIPPRAGAAARADAHSRFSVLLELMHVLDEQSPMQGYDMARVIDADAHVFVTLEARDPTLATVVHDIHSYVPEDIRFGMRYVDVVTTAEDGTPVADLTRMGELEPDVGDRPEPGWTEREEELG